MDTITKSHMAPPKSSMLPIPTSWLRRVAAPVRRPRGQSLTLSHLFISRGSKSTASILLIVNLVLYFIVIVIASWAINHGIQRSRKTASGLSILARIFPIYFPFGNTAIGFFVIFFLLQLKWVLRFAATEAKYECKFRV
ncbi:hypothetical protein ACFX15_029332 [Malus domestica]